MDFGILAGQGLHIAVLGKQRDGQHGFASQHHIQVFQQCKAGFFQGLHGREGEVLRLPNVVLHGRFHGAQYQPHLGLIDHVQRTGRLVQLLFGHAQWTGVQGRQIGVARLLRFQDETPSQPNGTFERLAQLFLNPRERA